MTIDQAQRNKQAVRDGVERVFNLKKLEAIDDLYTEDFVDHSAPPGLPVGIDGARVKIGAFIDAFPDLQLTYEFQVAEDDFVAGRFVLSGTHQGEFGGVAATGNSVRVTGHDLLRLRDGKVCEHWLELDTLSLMQQLGAIAA